MSNSNIKLRYYFSIPIFIGMTLVLLVLLTIWLFVSYVLILKEFNLLIIIFIWSLYGLLFRDAIPKIFKMGKNIFTRTPALIFTHDKLIDNINSKQFLWNEIENIDEYYDIRTGSYIAICVKNPNDFLLVERSFYERSIMRLNSKYWNGMFAIRPKMLKCKKQELLNNLQSHLLPQS